MKMKKKYVKPQFGVDMFAVAQSIAENCGWNHSAEMGQPGHASKDVCGWDMGNIMVFLDTMTGICDWQIPEDESIENYCYNNPNGGTTIFAS